MAKQTGTRTRSYGEMPKVRNHTRTHSWSSGKFPACDVPEGPFYLDYAYADDYDYTVMTDVVTPNFHRRIKSGELILNPMSWSRLAFSAADGHSMQFSMYRDGSCFDRSYNSTGTANMSKIYIDLGRGPNCPLLETDVVSDAQLIVQAMAGVDPTTYHVMEDILQLRQFASSIRHPIQGIKDIADKWTRQGGKLRARALADAWAKYRWEILPLLQTAEALIRTALGPCKRLEKGVRLRSAAVTSGHDTQSGVYTGAGGTVDWNCNNSRVTRKRAVIYYTLSRAHSGISQNLGTRFKDLPTGLWNTITLTFMLDRLINISQFITAVSNLCDPDIRVEGGCLTTWDYSFVESQVLRERYGSPTDRVLDISTSSVIAVADTVVRTVLETSDIVKAASSPLSNDFRPQDLVGDTSRVLDLLALTIQKFKL